MTSQRIAALSMLAVWCAQCTSPAQPTNSIPEEMRRQVTSRVADALPRLEPLYKQFHAHPELSLREERTSGRVADELEQAGFKVMRRVGGYGVVGVLSNGNGPTVL